MLRLVPTSLVVSICALAALGCSPASGASGVDRDGDGEIDGPADGPGGVDGEAQVNAVVALREAFRARECEWAVRCDQVPNSASCTAIEDFLDWHQWIEDAGAGHLTVDAASVDACLALWGGMTCDVSFPDHTVWSSPSCQAALRGSIAEGERCFSGKSCASGLTCAPTSEEPCTSICVPPAPLGAIGQSCESGPCEYGVACYSQEDELVCTEIVADTEACDRQALCRDGSYCLDGRCAPLPGEGQPCPGGECVGDYRTHECNPWTVVCVRLPDASQPCSDTGNCRGYAYCNDDGTCVPRPGRGEACPDDVCLGDLHCRDGICGDLLQLDICEW